MVSSWLLTALQGTLSSPDGSGVITSTNSLNGDIIVNFNGNGSTTGGIG